MTKLNRIIFSMILALVAAGATLLVASAQSPEPNGTD